jgi:hypothetical protein
VTQGDVLALGRVVEQRRIEADDAERPAAIGGVVAHRLQAGRRGDGAAGIQRGVYPGRRRLLGPREGVVQGVPAEKQPGKSGTTTPKALVSSPGSMAMG